MIWVVVRNFKFGQEKEFQSIIQITVEKKIGEWMMTFYIEW